MVSNAELREEDGHLPVYVTRMPHLVPHLLHHFVFRFVGFLCFVKKKHSNIVQSAVKSFSNKGEFPYVP